MNTDHSVSMARSCARPEMTARIGGAASPHLHHDIAGLIERGVPARRHNAGRIVFLDDQRPGTPAAPAVRCRKIRAPNHGRFDESVRGTEPRRAWWRQRRLRSRRLDALGYVRSLTQARAYDLNCDELDRLLRPRAVAVGALVLCRECLLE